MSMTGRGARIAAAVFVAGLSVAGPYATGVAVAETGEDDASSASANADPAGASPSAGPGSGRADARPSRSGAGASPTSPSASQRARVPGPAANGIRPGANGGQRSGESTLRRLPAAVSGRVPGPAAARAERSQTAPITDPQPSREAPVPPAAVAATVVPRITAVADAQGAEVDRCENCWAFGYSGGGGGRETPTGFLVPARPVEVVGFSITRVIDRVGNWLSTLPANPITARLSGGLWLLRRAISPVGTGVGLWGSADCVATKDCTGQNLDGADLRGEDLAAVNFAGASLRRADLSDVRLTVANLSDADLGGATLAGASLSGATLLAADLTGASLAGASLPNADLGGVNLTGADLSWANLIGANIAGATLTGAIWRDTTCPDGSTSSSGCSSLLSSENKPGLISSDRLKVVKETGEWNGDEPVLLTTLLTTTLGYAGSSKSNLVDSTPNEIGSGVDAGNEVSIPDEAGDTWINYWSETDGDGQLVKGFIPLSMIDVASAAINKRPVPIPVVVQITFALEGDMSLPGLVGGLGSMFLQEKLDALGRELEATKVYVGTTLKSVTVTSGGSGYTEPPAVTFTGGHRVDEETGIAIGKPAEGKAIVTGGVVTGVEITDSGSGYIGVPKVIFEGGGGSGAAADAVLTDTRPQGDQINAVLDDAKKRIVEALDVRWYEYVALAMKRIGDWFFSAADPDDPVALSATLLIPVDADVIDYIKANGGPKEFGFDDNYTRLVDADGNKDNGQQDVEIRTVPFDANIQVRYGLLVPAGTTGNQPPTWTTKYSGEYLENKWAEWEVQTQAWARATWK